MKFAKVVFWIAGVWGVLVLTPLYFMFDVIGRDPVRFRLMMIPAVLDKFGYGGTLTALYLQHRLHPSDLVFGGVDALFGVLFLVAFFRTKSS
jgi:hypothetical protein